MHRGLITKSPPILIGGYESPADRVRLRDSRHRLRFPFICVFCVLCGLQKSVAAAVRRRMVSK